MIVQYILSEYIERAMAAAEYDKLDDTSFSGRITSCPGVIAFGDSLHTCEIDLRSVLEDWILLGLKLGHHLPIIDHIDLNQEPQREPVEPV